MTDRAQRFARLCQRVARLRGHFGVQPSNFTVPNTGFFVAASWLRDRSCNWTAQKRRGLRIVSVAFPLKDWTLVQLFSTKG